MKEIAMANRAADWQRLKALELDSVSSPITRRVYNLGLDEFISWYSEARGMWPCRSAGTAPKVFTGATTSWSKGISEPLAKN